jgi:hypothetical protein
MKGGMKMPATETQMQQDFATHYVANGGNGAKAARDAGYSEKSARVIAHKLVNNQTVQGLIQRELGKLRYRSGTVGLNALTSIAEDAKAPQAARVAAARALLEHAGLIGSAREPGELPEAPGGNVTSYEEWLERMGQTRRAANG